MALKRTGGDRVKLGSVRSAVEFQTTELSPAKRQRIITMNVPWSSYNFRIESLTQKLLYAKCCYTPFLFLDLETDWVMRRRKSFLEVFSTRFLQNCNTILWNDGFTCRPYAIAEPGFNMPCNYAETIIGNEPSSCLSEESSVANFCISLQHLIHTINKRHLLLELLKHITACQFHANYPQRHI
ncbi:unnamed protein product [Brassica napus]|uniref:(rape) hypothetical protein n=1 Tax=Brassica napus TaxID=3708 RepID=A0A816JLQ5_BRANA|nr:unnamed protein product [Brassica napus]